MRAEVLTPWVGTWGSETDSPRPQLLDDHGPLSLRDTTNQPDANIPPDPNLVIVWIECSLTVLDAIEADDNYSVMWKDTGKDSMPDAAEFGLLRAQLAQAGVKQSEIKSVIGTNVSGRTRAEIAATLKDWLKTRPKVN